MDAEELTRGEGWMEVPGVESAHLDSAPLEMPPLGMARAEVPLETARMEPAEVTVPQADVTKVEAAPVGATYIEPESVETPRAEAAPVAVAQVNTKPLVETQAEMPAAVAAVIEEPPEAIQDRWMPNATLRLLFMSIEEVMGADGMKAVLNGAHLQQYIGNYPPNTLDLGVKFSEYGLAEQAVETFYGPRGARAMLTRVGREVFRYGLREQSAVLGMAGNALKSLPLISMQAKMKILLQQIVSAANKTVNQPTRLEEDAESFIMVVDQCVCEYRPYHPNPCCLVTVGTLTEAMKWLTDKPFDIKEITCLNVGADACRYRIPKKAGADL